MQTSRALGYDEPMERYFNVAGMCRPNKHYMVEPEGRLAKLRPLIDREAWFVVHAPRQSGKTTTTRLLAEALTAEGRYAAVLASCKPGSTAGDDLERGIQAVLLSFDRECRGQLPAELRPSPASEFADIAAEGRLGAYLATWCERCPRPVVLFLDEIDALVGKARALAWELVEIKVRRDKDGDPLDEGLDQLSEYLDRLGMDEGTLVLFDQRGDAPSVTERCSRREQVHRGRRITVLRL